MASVSSHLHTRPYRVATTTEPSQPFRKWDHIGIRHAVSHRSAAFLATEGDIVGESSGEQGVVFEFSTGLFVQVSA